MNPEHPMINVDGIKKHLHNSDNTPYTPTEEGVRNSHRWFGNSKAVDKHDRPQVLYHGTGSDFRLLIPIKMEIILVNI